MRDRKAVFIILLFFVLAASGLSQGYKGQGRFSGVVTDKDGKPLEGVKVKLFSVRGQSGFETETDREGKWRANYVRGGAWNIDFEKPGYMPKKITVQINEFDRNKPITISLEEMAGLAVAEEMKAELARGNVLFDEGKYEEAIQVYLNIIAKNPEMDIIYQNIGNCYFQMQKYDKAEEAYRKILERDPQNAQAILLIGNCYANRGDEAKAMEWYGKVEFEKIKDPIVLFNIGSSLYKQSKLEPALSYYQRAVNLQPDFLDAIYYLGMVNLAMNKLADAIAAFESYLKQDADSPRASQVKSFLELLRKK